MSCKTSSSAITLKRVEPRPTVRAATQSENTARNSRSPGPNQQTATSTVFMPFTPPSKPKSAANNRPKITVNKPNAVNPASAKEAKDKLENVLKKQLILTAFSPAEIRRDRLGKPLIQDEYNRAQEVVIKPRKSYEDANTSKASITLSKSVPNSPAVMRRREDSLVRANMSKGYRPSHYGTPVVGSKTEERAILAHKRICKEVMQLCEVIDEHGTEDPNDFKVKITFGRLFELYTFISDKVVGILLRARKHKLLEFEGETLFQGQDNKKVISLLIPIHAIQKKLAAEEEREFSWGKCM